MLEMDKIEKTRRKIEVRYHEYEKRHSKGNRQFYRRRIEQGWDAYEKRFNQPHPEQLWDDYESKGITVDSNAVAHIRAAWMGINADMDLFRDLDMPKLPPPRAWFMWPVSDEFSLWHEATYPMSRMTPRPSIEQVKQWMDEFNSLEAMKC